MDHMLSSHPERRFRFQRYFLLAFLSNRPKLRRFSKFRPPKSGSTGSGFGRSPNFHLPNLRVEKSVSAQNDRERSGDFLTQTFDLLEEGSESRQVKLFFYYRFFNPGF